MYEWKDTVALFLRVFHSILVMQSFISIMTLIGVSAALLLAVNLPMPINIWCAGLSILPLIEMPILGGLSLHRRFTEGKYI